MSAHEVYLAVFLLSAVLQVSVATVNCPLQSSSRPSNIQLTSSDDTCDYHVAMGPNEHDPAFVDIYLEGKEKGWVAVGFSHDNKMAETDVIGCKQDSSGAVGIIDSWNGALPPNRMDPTQEGMCNYVSQYQDGRFSCLFSRYADIINVGYDYNFNGSYYLLLGCSTIESNVTSGFPFHWPHHPVATDVQYNPYVKTSLL